MTGKAAGSWIGVILTSVALLVGASVYVASLASPHDIEKGIESHSKTVHSGTERALDQMREDMQQKHTDLKDFIREIHK